MKILILPLFCLFLILGSCINQNRPTYLKSGDWLFQLSIDKENRDLTIPFNVEVKDSMHLVIKNAAEEIEVYEISYKADSVFIKMPVFGSEFKGLLLENEIKGEYFNYNKTKLIPIPFTAIHGKKERFALTTDPDVEFSGFWQAFFGSPENGSKAIGSFKQDQSMVSGTFQTEVGDYRFLEGVVNGNKMQLSCFDGAHAFLFTATLNNGEIDGMFYSGNTWQQKWTAVKTEDPQLGDMKSLTFLKPGYDKLSFRFPNDLGKEVSPEDEKYKNKVVIVQIFGTWCPNCMDETRYLVELYNKYNSKGLEIIGLDFETQHDFEYFKKRITRFRNDLNVPYELLLAGPANKKLAAEALPMLNKVISYPTAIFMDKNGSVREIHTGFSGPGTGNDYEHYKQETETLLKELLDED